MRVKPKNIHSVVSFSVMNSLNNSHSQLISVLLVEEPVMRAGLRFSWTAHGARFVTTRGDKRTRRQPVVSWASLELLRLPRVGPLEVEQGQSTQMISCAMALNQAWSVVSMVELGSITALMTMMPASCAIQQVFVKIVSQRRNSSSSKSYLRQV